MRDFGRCPGGAARPIRPRLADSISGAAFGAVASMGCPACEDGVWAAMRWGDDHPAGAEVRRVLLACGASGGVLD